MTAILSGVMVAAPLANGLSSTLQTAPWNQRIQFESCFDGARPPNTAVAGRIAFGSCRFVTHAGNVRSFPLCSVDIMIMAVTDTYADPVETLLGIVEVPKQETPVSADLRDETDRIDKLAHVLADQFGRKVVVVWPDDTEVVIEPRAERRLDG